MAKVLYLRFLNEAGKTVSFTIDNPIEPMDEALVNVAMTNILAQDAFATTGGKIVAKKEAVVVERNVEEIILN